MEKNVGTIDKSIRILLAVVLIALGYIYNIWVLYIIALIPFITAFVSFCPLYTLFRFNTKKK
jgi:hypothetical protein